MIACWCFLNCSWFKIDLEDEMAELERQEDTGWFFFKQPCVEVGSSSCCLVCMLTVNGTLPFIKMPGQNSKVKRHMTCQTAENVVPIRKSQFAHTGI